MSAMAEIRLWVDGPSPKRWHVEVDGKEISSAVRRATLNLAVDDLATLELEVYPNKIELPEAVMMRLKARLAEPRWRRWFKLLAFKDERHEFEEAFKRLFAQMQEARREMTGLRYEIEEIRRATLMTPLSTFVVGRQDETTGPET
jgi:hypothetical protein